MILHAQAKHGKPGLPWLVFLHGFSGDCHEWQEVGEAFADYSRLYVDLPGHGGSATISVDGFDDVTGLLCKTLVSYNILNFWLVGLLAWRTGGDDGGLPGAGGALWSCCRRRASWIAKVLNNARNVSVPIANGRSVFVQNR